MAKIPQAPVGGINLTHETPVREIPKMQTTGDILQDVGQGITSVADVMERAYSLAEKTKAQNLLSVKLADIQSRAEADTDFSPQTRDKYHQEIDSALRESSSGISIQQNKDLFQSEAQKDADLSKLRINHDFMRKAIDSGKADLLVRRDTLKNQFIASGSTTEQNNAILQDNALIDEAVNSGFMSREDAAKARLDRAKDWMVDWVKQDIYSDNATQEDQSLVLAELRKGDSGKYAGLPPDARVKAEEESQRRIFQNNQTFKRAVADSQGQRNDNLVEKIASQSATLKDIDNEMAIPEEAGGMKRNTLLTYQRALQSGITKDLNRMLTEKTDPNDKNSEPSNRAKQTREYLDFIDNYIDDKTDMWKAREYLAKAYEDGHLSPKELGVLNGIKKDAKNIDANRSKWPAFNNIRLFLNKMKGYTATDEEIALNLKSLLHTGDVTEAGVLQSLNNHVKSKVPGVATLPKEGGVFFDKDGNQFTIYPDGSIK